MKTKLFNIHGKRKQICTALWVPSQVKVQDGNLSCEIEGVLPSSCGSLFQMCCCVYIQHQISTVFWLRSRGRKKHSFWISGSVRKRQNAERCIHVSFSRTNAQPLKQHHSVMARFCKQRFRKKWNFCKGAVKMSALQSIWGDEEDFCNPCLGRGEEYTIIIYLYGSNPSSRCNQHNHAVEVRYFAKPSFVSCAEYMRK